MDNCPPSDGDPPKRPKRCVATAKTSGLPEYFRRKLREKKARLEEEAAIRKRARDERIRIFKRYDIEYYSEGDRSSTSSEEWIEYETPHNKKDTNDKLLEVMEKDPQYDYENLFIKKDEDEEDWLEFKKPQTKNEIEDSNVSIKEDVKLFECKKNNPRKDSRYDSDDLFILKDEEDQTKTDIEEHAKTDKPKTIKKKVKLLKDKKKNTQKDSRYDYDDLFIMKDEVDSPEFEIPQTNKDIEEDTEKDKQKKPQNDRLHDYDDLFIMKDHQDEVDSPEFEISHTKEDIEENTKEGKIETIKNVKSLEAKRKNPRKDSQCDYDNLFIMKDEGDGNY